MANSVYPLVFVLSLLFSKEALLDLFLVNFGLLADLELASFDILDVFMFLVVPFADLLDSLLMIFPDSFELNFFPFNIPADVLPEIYCHVSSACL